MKKRLVGGDFLIDLSSLPLDDEYEDEEIADSNVLEQLSGLKGFIGKDKSIKPLWVKAFVDTGDYTAEVVTRGELNKNNLIFKLVVLLATFKLMIDVEFEQLEDGDGNAIDDYAIDSATYTFTSDASVGGDLNVTGDASVGGDLSVNESSKVKVFENIVDKDGHNRFIEGDIELKTGLSGITKSFAKWSLSGSHLMIVIAGSVANATAFSYGALTEYLNLPQWIKDKLVVSFGSASVSVDYIKLYASDLTTQEVQVFLVKSIDNIYVIMESITLTKDRNFRIEFDLLIDNE